MFLAANITELVYKERFVVGLDLELELEGGEVSGVLGLVERVVWEVLVRREGVGMSSWMGVEGRGWRAGLGVWRVADGVAVVCEN